VVHGVAYRDAALAANEVSVLRMLTTSREELRRRTQDMCDRIAQAGGKARVVEAAANVGRGALPLLALTGPACAVDPASHSLDERARRLRVGRPSVLGRALGGRLLLDPRTLTDDEVRRAVVAVIAALA
jgi:L-seryl-tRNA(Ser) seleniumtransferase